MPKTDIKGYSSKTMGRVKYRYSIVTFLDLPYKDINWYICVPNSWVKSRITKEKVVVAYPTECPEETRKRVKKRQKVSTEWNEYTALLRYETDYFDDAQIYILTKNNESMGTSSRDVILPTTSSSSERKRRSSRRNDSTNPKIKPQMTVAPFRGDVQSVMKLTIRRMTLPVPNTQKHKNCPKTDDTARDTNLLNRFECINENDHQNSIEITERHNRQNNYNTENERDPPNAADQSMNPEYITEHEFIRDFSILIKQLNMICTDTQSMVKNLKETFIESEETIKNVLRSIGDYNKSNINNDSAFTTTADQKITNTNQNRKDNKKIYNLDDGDDEYVDKDEEDNDNDNESDADSDHNDDDTDDVDTDVNFVKNKPRKIKQRQNIRTFVLPPEYDPYDTKWTLKHREYRPGLVELMPKSGVFVDAIQLANCKRLSTDTKQLARKVLLEIFSRNALSVCSLTGARANAFSDDNKDIRPGLDTFARNVLFTYVEEYGREKGWHQLEGQTVVNSVRSKIQEMRAKFGRES